MRSIDTLQQPTPLNVWFANCLRSMANYYDPPKIAPTVKDLAHQQLARTEIELLQAEADLEHATHTVAMLKARIDRLKRPG